MLDKIIEIISEYQGLEKEKIKENSNLVTDIGLSSFDVTELVCRVEDEFDVQIPDRLIRSLQTVGDIVNYVSEQKKNWGRF